MRNAREGGGRAEMMGEVDESVKDGDKKGLCLFERQTLNKKTVPLFLIYQ